MAENGQALIKLDGVTKVFFTDEVENARAVGDPPGDRQGRVCGDRRAVGLRQVDAAVDSRPARFADRRPVPAEQPAGRRTAARRSARACATARSGSSSRAST